MIGALIGKQKGRNIEVMNSFELNFDTIDSQIVIDMEYYNTKEEQCKNIIFLKLTCIKCKFLSQPCRAPDNRGY